MTLLAAPALPLHTAGKYVAGAYIIFVVVLVIYLGIMALRTGRTQRDLAELRRELAERQSQEGPGDPGASAGAGTARRPERQSETAREPVR